MPKVLCTLPNASDNINGVQFVTHADGMLSVDIDDDIAANFCQIPGYQLHEAKKAAATEAQPKQGNPELDALRARATELGIEFKNNWGAARLKAEVQEAEEALTQQPTQGDTTTGEGEAPAGGEGA
jgi:hypothetical protein